MKRKNLHQISDQAWFPKHLKQLVDEFLSWFVVQVNATKPFIPLFEKALSFSDKKVLVDIDFSTGAGMESCRHLLDPTVQVETIAYDGFRVEKEGVYVIINALHKLSPDQVIELLGKIAGSGKSVVAVEGNNDNWWQAIGMTLFVPLAVFLSAPFVKPFRWTRLLFTYLIPVLLLIIPLDGIIALFKLYSPKDLNELTDQLKVPAYNWESGKKDNGRGGKIIYLMGLPEQPGSVR